MIKNIIFDLGNVLLNFKPLEYMYTKIPEKQTARQIYKEIFESEEWIMLDRGIIAEDEAIKTICDRNIEQSYLIKYVMHNWYQLFTPKEDVIDLLKELKNKGYKIYFLSNFHLLAFQEIHKRYEFFEYLDGGIVSCEVKFVKPEKEIYKKLIDTYKIEPNESIFIDDLKENIDGATNVEIKTILFTSYLELRKSLIGYGALNN